MTQKMDQNNTLLGVGAVLLGAGLLFSTMGGGGKNSSLYRSPQGSAGGCTSCSGSGSAIKSADEADLLSSPAKADPTLDVRAAGWARQMAARKFLSPDAKFLPPPPNPNARFSKRGDFQERLAEAADQDVKVTPIALSFEQSVDMDSAATRTFPLYASKSIDPFIGPYFRTQANPGAADQAYYRAQTF